MFNSSADPQDTTDVDEMKYDNDEKKIRMLFLSANPIGTDPLNINEEYLKLATILQSPEFEQKFLLIPSIRVTYLNFSRYLLKVRPHIVHFSGHGSKQGRIILENEDGNMEEANPDALADLFRIVNSNEQNKAKKIRLVVLSACYTKEQAIAMSKYVECVIGTTRSIKDSTAILFAEAFYQALHDRGSLGEAFELGSNWLLQKNDPDRKRIRLVHKADINPATIFLSRKVVTNGERIAASIIEKKTVDKQEVCSALSAINDIIQEWYSYLNHMLSKIMISNINGKKFEETEEISTKFLKLLTRKELISKADDCYDYLMDIYKKCSTDDFKQSVGTLDKNKLSNLIIYIDMYRQTAKGSKRKWLERSYEKRIWNVTPLELRLTQEGLDDYSGKIRKVTLELQKGLGCRNEIAERLRRGG